MFKCLGKKWAHYYFKDTLAYYNREVERYKGYRDTECKAKEHFIHTVNKLEKDILLNEELMANTLDIVKKELEAVKRENLVLRSAIMTISDEKLLKLKTDTSKYDPNFGDDKVCECGHAYFRHFDTYENMEAVGCKYCGCEFKEKVK